MNNKEIGEMKETIVADYEARIERLREEMKIELSLLSRFASRFQTTETIETTTKKQRSRKKAGTGKHGKSSSAKARIRAAKKVITGRFLRKDLHNAVNNDGFGEMKDGTFSPNVSRLLADKEIIEIETAIGTKPAVYMWPEERNKPQDVLL